MDIIGALVGIILFSPIMALAALYVKLVSPKGPILVEPKGCMRSGKNGKPFRMYKFRSMVPNAHELMLKDPELARKYRESNYKIEDDPRWIPYASLIRKTSIDEFPQFFNVLKGEMSIVGPRAYFPNELVEQSEKYPESKEHIQRIIHVKPGITGPWQVGGRSEIGFVDRVKMDSEYAKKRSLLYDLQIILKTPVAVITQRGSL
jgi:lipopolysaccharide/colanic/teichoic acid biosynthesis glycosyltransferase